MRLLTYMSLSAQLQFCGWSKMACGRSSKRSKCRSTVIGYGFMMFMHNHDAHDSVAQTCIVNPQSLCYPKLDL